MIIFRPIRISDLENYVKLAQSAHGFYTLPKDRKLLSERLELSCASINKQVSTAGSELYTFVAVDLKTEEILGVSAIAATTGGTDPLYFFRKEHIDCSSRLEAAVKKIPILNPISYVRGTSEMCSLFVSPEHRKTGAGKLLSLARFLFVAKFPERFTNSLFAELRGRFDENKINIFWEGIGRHFFNASLDEVHSMLQYGRAFLGQFLPKHPIYLSLLPENVQQAVGQIDSGAEAAFRMLTKQGFQVTDEIDVLDGGPKLRAFKEQISTIKNSRIFSVAEIHETIHEQKEFLISNEQREFRATIATVKITNDQSAILTKDVAQALEVGLSDPVRLYDFHEER